jgi:serine/threonine protein phosphatase 1
MDFFPAFRTRKRDGRERVRLDLDDTVVYAVGDVHGCYKELLSLERKIVDDATVFHGRKLIVMLGDYVDRGRESAKALDHLSLPPPKGFQRICLAGNHEIMMLKYLDGELPRDAWLAAGALSTLSSYGIDLDRLSKTFRNSKDIDRQIQSVIPAAHVEFLRSLPIMAYTDKVVFVHAGIRPGTGLDDQIEEDLVHIRSEFFAAAHLLDRMVIHGHTRVKAPAKEGNRLGIDTGAYETGRLTAVRIAGKHGKLIFS